MIYKKKNKELKKCNDHKNSSTRLNHKNGLLGSHTNNFHMEKKTENISLSTNFQDKTLQASTNKLIFTRQRRSTSFKEL